MGAKSGKQKKPGRSLTRREPQQLTFTLPGATAVSLKLPANLEFRVYEQMGKQLRTISTASKWWVGDYLVYGEQTYGEEYAQVMDSLGASVEGVSRAMKVSQRIEPARRRRSLSWTHHALVAGLEPEEQDTWLDRAVKEKWTSAELRDALKGEVTEKKPRCCQGCACRGDGCECATPPEGETGADNQ